MQEWVAADPSRTIRIFASHEEQAEWDVSYEKSHALAEKIRVVTEVTEIPPAKFGRDSDAHGIQNLYVTLAKPRI